jgi:hypothetical protein
MEFYENIVKYAIWASVWQSSPDDDTIIILKYVANITK